MICTMDTLFPRLINFCLFLSFTHKSHSQFNDFHKEGFDKMKRKMIKNLFTQSKIVLARFSV